MGDMRQDPPQLRDSSLAMSRCERAKRIAELAKSRDGVPPESKSGKKKAKDAARMTDLFVLRVSTRWFDWTPIEVTRCDAGTVSTHTFSFSMPVAPADRLADLLAKPDFQNWFAKGKQTPLSAAWWALFLPRPAA